MNGAKCERCRGLGQYACSAFVRSEASRRKTGCLDEIVSHRHNPCEECKGTGKSQGASGGAGGGGE